MVLAISPEKALQLIYRAMDAGTHPDPLVRKLEWDISNGCGQPHIVNLVSDLTDRSIMASRPHQHIERFEDGTFTVKSSMKVVKIRKDILDNSIKQPYYIDLVTPCRTKCEVCRQHRAKVWAQRAYHETAYSSRTWFMTLTCSPHQRVRAHILARQKYGNETFNSISKIVMSWFTLYLKRVRKQSGVKFRYLLAVEPHKDGFPHLHVLIHERGQEIRKRLLEAQWRSIGITSCELVQNGKASAYVTKYIAKQFEARIRASLKYGRSTSIEKLNFSCPLDPPLE